MSESSPSVETLPKSPARAPAGSVAAARLVVVHPPELRAVIGLDETPTVLGRDPASGVVGLGHGTVSRRHVAIVWDPAARCHRGRDLGSKNGASVDGAGAQAAWRLVEGSVLRIADVHLVYERQLADDGDDAEVVARDAVPGEAAVMAPLRARIARAAGDAAPVLLCGETGTGKERIAGELHRLSGRRGPYLAVNCAALARELIESQLFGHVRGAFTGAGEAQPGLFRSADGGTVLLDEIGDLPLELQPKLLRVLEEGEVHPVGSARPVTVDVRVIAATHRDLAVAAETGEFRRDLYARLSLWEIQVPALRQRRVDLLPWLDRLRGAGGAISFEPDAVERLLLAPWPTNLRGLDRLLRELPAHARPVAAYELPAWITAPPASAEVAQVPIGRPPPPTREEFLAAFDQHGGSVHALARHFQRDRRQIYRWLDAYRLDAKH